MEADDQVLAIRGVDIDRVRIVTKRLIPSDRCNELIVGQELRPVHATIG